ncbi:hypothetical protein Tco_0678653 [Tanacetum coccineum]|uniref:Uncharacterized protein n=1 Tax=Tanacetum coccineum TaxID=301880 RepID=A0ABQ4XFN6_9ASTR
MLAPSGGGLILHQAYGNLYVMTGRKAHLLEDTHIPSVGVFDEVTWMAFGGNTCDLGSFGEETEKTTTLHQEPCRIIHSEPRDGVVTIKRRRHDIYGDGEVILVGDGAEAVEDVVENESHLIPHFIGDRLCALAMLIKMIIVDRGGGCHAKHSIESNDGRGGGFVDLGDRSSKVSKKDADGGVVSSGGVALGVVIGLISEVACGAKGVLGGHSSGVHGGATLSYTTASGSSLCLVIRGFTRSFWPFRRSNEAEMIRILNKVDGSFVITEYGNVIEFDVVFYESLFHPYYLLAPLAGGYVFCFRGGES